MNEHGNDELKRGIVAALSAERWQEALAKLEIWCDRFPEHSRSWLNQGYCLFHLGRYDEAVSAFDTCLKLDPSSTTAQGWRQRTLDELDKAHTVSHELSPSPVATEIARAAVSGVTQRVESAEGSAASYGTMGIPEARRGWQEGTVVDGRYEVRALARGGMAVVAIAFDRELRRMVAVKTPLPSVLASADGSARFQREAESWIALGVHPNICCAYYLQNIGGMPRLFIEYVDGGDLNEWLKRETEIDLPKRLDIAIQIASGLDYTHSFPWTDSDGNEHQGLVHRDIKPANVLVTREGIARVTDFGLVRAEGIENEGEGGLRSQMKSPPVLGGRSGDSVVSGSWQTVTIEGGLVGTPPYMAPELWRQALRGTTATDIYAYGCMLYEIFCGRRPFVMGSSSVSRTREAHLSGWMRMHLREDPPDPRTFNDSLEPRLAALLRSCIAKDVGRRPHSFALLRGWLVEIYEQATDRPYPRPEPKRTQLLADSLNNRGASYVTLGLAERAEASFHEALEIDPRHIEATFNSGLLEWRREGLTDAELERRLSEAERASGGATRAGLLRARLRLLLDDPSGALAAVDSLSRAEVKSLAGRREKGFALLASARTTSSRKELSQARELIRTVVVESPSDLPALLGFAECCSRLGDEEVASKAFEAAQSIDRDLPDDLNDAAAAHLPGHRIEQVMNHSAPVQAIRTLAGGWTVVRSADSNAVVWDRSSDEAVHRIKLGGSARPGRSMTVVDDTLIACIEDGPLTLFDLGNGQRLRNLRTHPGVATCVEASPDGKVIASGGSDRCLRLWNLESGECERTLEGHEAFVSAIAFHPNEASICTASADGSIRVWNLDQGRCVHVLEGHRGPVRALALHPTGDWAVSGGQDGAVGIWDLKTGENIRYLRGLRGAVTAVTMIGSSIASGGEDGTIRIWDFESGEAQRVIRLANPIQDLVADADGNELLAAFGSSVCRIAMPEPRASRLPLVLADTAASGELAGRETEFQAFLEEARGLIENGRAESAIVPLRRAREVRGYELHEEALKLWNRVLAFFPKEAPRSVVELRRFGSGQVPMTACALTVDGAGCVAGCGDGTIRIFDAVSGAERIVVDAHKQGVTSVAVSADGQHFASAGRDHTVRVGQLSDGKKTHSFDGHEGTVQAVVFTPDGRAVISAGDDGTVRLWPLDDSLLPELLGSSQEGVSAIAASADGQYLVRGGWNSLVTVWSLRRRAELRRMEGHEGSVHAVAVSPDCRLTASSGEDGTVRLWDLEGGRCWRVLTGHDGPVLAIAFSPDARFLLSAGKDSTIRLWDARTGSAVWVVEGHAGPIADISIARDGGGALSAGSDSSLRLWFLDWEPELPERGSWDDRVLPFLKVFIRQREGENTNAPVPKWTEDQLKALLTDLERRGYGWLAPDRVERELEKLVRFRAESRTEERERTQQLAEKRQREERVAPAKQIIESATRNIGLKAAGAAAAVIVILLAMMSLRSPGGGPEFNRHQKELAIKVQGRGMMLTRGTAHAYQNRPSVGLAECGEGHFPDFVDLAVDTERIAPPEYEPGKAASEGFSSRYANAVNCVGTFGTVALNDRILQRAKQGLHSKRLEDLLGILVRIGADTDPRFADALNDNSETVRHITALALFYGVEKTGKDLLIAALESGEGRNVEAASSVLIELISSGKIAEGEAFELIEQFSRNIDPRVRRNAVRALILFENKGPARDVLNDALEDSDPEVVDVAERTKEMLRIGKANQVFG